MSTTKHWPFYATQPETTPMTTTDPTPIAANDTPQPDASEAGLHTQLLAALLRIEDRLNSLWDVLTAQEDEEIQLDLTAEDTGRTRDPGQGLG